MDDTSNPNHELNYELMSIVARDVDVVANWEYFASSFLQLPPEAILDIKTRNRNIDGYVDPPNALYSSLDLWKERYSFAATAELMRIHLLDFGSYDTANIIGDIIKMPPVEPRPANVRVRTHHLSDTSSTGYYHIPSLPPQQPPSVLPPFHRLPPTSSSSPASSPPRRQSSPVASPTSGRRKATTKSPAPPPHNIVTQPYNVVVTSGDVDVSGNIGNITVRQTISGTGSGKRNAVTQVVIGEGTIGAERLIQFATDDTSPHNLNIENLHVGQQHSGGDSRNSGRGLSFQSAVYKQLFNVEQPLMRLGEIEFALDAIIASNPLSQVYRGRFKNSAVAIKRSSLNSPLSYGLKNLVRKDLSHVNMVRYHKYEEDQQYIYIVMELALGSLEDVVRRKNNEENMKNVVSFIDILKIFFDIMTGLDFLHSPGIDGAKIIHGNMKPQNVLLKIVEDDKITALLADFGCGSKFGLDASLDYSGELNNTEIKPPAAGGITGYQPHEYLENGENATMTTCVDIFSAGCTVAYTATMGHHPFGDDDQSRVNNIKANISPSIHPLMFTVARFNDALFRDLIVKMISFDAATRPETKDVLANDLFDIYNILQ